MNREISRNKLQETYSSIASRIKEAFGDWDIPQSGEMQLEVPVFLGALRYADQQDGTYLTLPQLVRASRRAARIEEGDALHLAIKRSAQDIIKSRTFPTSVQRVR